MADELNDSAVPGPDGAGELLPQVYDRLRALACVRLAAEGAGHTLQPTALVHEAYLRLAGGGGEGASSGAGRRFADRAAFFRAAAEAMRRVLIDHARTKRRVKRGGRGGSGGGPAAKRVPLSVLDLAAAPDPAQILAFDEAIRRLEGESPQAAAVVRLRFYAGLSVDEAAEALGVSPRTVDREWAYARAWLFRVLECGDEDA